ncbi:MAG: hypothetical protein KDD40_06170 [Bdellovibrionales bacterium]|nr:hypothetical protein [Bdellovibrionales bacterium]
MTKRLLLYFILLGFISHVNIGCSSNKTEDEAQKQEAEASAEAGEEADFEEAGGDEFADGEEEAGGDEFAEEGEEAGDDEFADGEEEAGGDEFAEEGEDAGDDEFADETGSTGEDVAGTGETTDSSIADGGPATDASEELALDEGSIEEPTVGGENLTAGDTAEIPMEEPMSDGMMDEPVKSWVPVKKIANSPFMKSGVLVNAVYLARPGDTVESVSQKIYGNSSKAEELFTVNPTLRNRGVKTGDKIYYNSPQRPNDDSRMLVFYEDVGLQAETYVSQAGDNIRTVSKSILGDDNSWKEVWATNMDVESKSVLPEGTTLRYWASTSLPVANNNMATEPMDMAANDIPPPPEPSNDIPPPPPMDDMNESDIPPPPPTDMAANDIPPPPSPPPGGTMGSIEPPPPPPPPPMPKAQVKNAGAKKGGAFGSDPDVTMALGAAAIVLLAAAALIIMIRKRKQRQALADFANTQTHTQIE